MVAVVVDEALAVAEQIAVALQALIQELGIFVRPLGEAGIDDLDASRSSTPAIEAVARISSSRPTRIAEPRPWLTKLTAARMTCSSSPSAKTTRRGLRRTFSKMRCSVLAIGSRRAESWVL